MVGSELDRQRERVRVACLTKDRESETETERKAKIDRVRERFVITNPHKLDTLMFV